jgi:hypothetical protein
MLDKRTLIDTVERYAENAYYLIYFVFVNFYNFEMLLQKI